MKVGLFIIRVEQCCCTYDTSLKIMQKSVMNYILNSEIDRDLHLKVAFRNRAAFCILMIRKHYTIMFALNEWAADNMLIATSCNSYLNSLINKSMMLFFQLSRDGQNVYFSSFYWLHLGKKVKEVEYL